MKAPPLTKTQVNKAGKILRAWWKNEIEIDEVIPSYQVLMRFRAAHQIPLTKATMGLRSRVKTAGCRVEVSQRLKRVWTIIDKLDREPTMKLANMQDIGGCRAVLDSIDEVRRVQKRLRPKTQKMYDYIENPRDSGYRALHVIVEYDGRLTEVQLRTQLMHQWAFTVERLSGRLEVDLKGGKGPQPILDWLKAVSEAMVLEEAGQSVDTETLERIQALREEALPLIHGGS